MIRHVIRWWHYIPFAVICVTGWGLCAAGWHLAVWPWIGAAVAGYVLLLAGEWWRHMPSCAATTGGQRAFERARQVAAATDAAGIIQEAAPLHRPLTAGERTQWMRILVFSYDGPELAALYSPASRRPGDAA